MARGPRTPFRGLSIRRALPAGRKTYFTVVSSRRVKPFAVVSKDGKVSCSSCRSVTCEHAGFIQAYLAASVSRPVSPLGAEWIAQFDAMAAARRAGTPRPATGCEAPGASSSAVPASSSPPRKKRRTKAQMAEARAAVQAKRDAITATLPDWLRGRNQDLDDFAASLREEGPRDP